MTANETPLPNAFPVPAATPQTIPSLWNVPLPTKVSRVLEYRSPEVDDIPPGQFRLWTRRFGEHPVFINTPKAKQHGHFDSREKALGNPQDVPEIGVLENAIRMLESDVREQRVFHREAKPKIQALRDRLQDANRRILAEEEILSHYEREIFNDRMYVKFREYLLSVDPLQPLCNRNVAQMIGANAQERDWVLGFFQTVRGLRQDIRELYNAASAEGEKIYLVVDLVRYRTEQYEAEQAAEKEKADEMNARAKALIDSI